MRGQLQRVEPHAHSVLALAEDIHVAHARHTLDCVFHINIEIVRDELVRVATITREKSGAEDKIAIRLADADARRIHRGG